MDREKIKNLIEEEKNAFVAAEYGRLQSIMGEEYTENGQTLVFHPLPEPEKDEERVIGNPKELTLTELAALPWLFKSIDRFGAVTDMPIIYIHPTDKQRLPLLERAQQALITGVEMSREDEAKLLEGHDAYMEFTRSKQEEPVVIKGL